MPILARSQLREAIATLDAEKIYVSAIVSDNASAMVKAAKALTITLPTDEDEGDEQPESETDEDEADPEVGEQRVEVEVELPKLKRFCPHVRCWAHSLQLLFVDAQKGCKTIQDGFAAVGRIVPLLQLRASRKKLKELTDENVTFITPAVEFIFASNEATCRYFKLLEFCSCGG